MAVLLLALSACGGEPGPGDTGEDPGIGNDLGDQGIADRGPADEGPPDPGQDLWVPDTGDDIPRDIRTDVDPGFEDNGTDEGDGTDESPADADVPEDATDIEEVCELFECLPPCPDDGLVCTETYRDEDTWECVTVILDGYCLARGACWLEGTVDLQVNPCMGCQPDVDPTEMTPRIGAECDDPTPCSTGGVCNSSGACVPATPICDDGNECTIDRCVGGTCTHSPKTSTCNDNDACTYGDYCDNGVCVGYPVSCVADNNPCTDNFCDPVEGCTFTYNSDPCNDNNWCSDDDKCTLGTCVGTPKNCDDGNPCTRDSCQGFGECVHQPYTNQPCDDGDKCTVNEYCNLEYQCVGGTPRICNDNNSCTDDSCDSAIGCVFTPNTSACNDGDPCTVADQCQAGKCVGSPRICNDNNPCTSDSCVDGACRYSPLANNTPCDDGDVCTIGERCVNSICEKLGMLSCDDGNACTVDACITGVGCSYTTRNCDDGNPCTLDACNPATGCTYSPTPGGCNDSDPCTVNDQCTGGTCVGSPMDCNDNDPCTTDACQNGICVHAPHFGPCEDGNLCTAGEICIAGSCEGGVQIDCSDGNTCTNDSCDPARGCVNTPVGGSPSCDDYSVCTTNDKCVSGQCVGTPIVCSDGNYCTDDLCNPVTGCNYPNNNLLCNDSNPCTINDQCGGGSCQGANLFRNPVTKSATLRYGILGAPGEGLDLDDNPNTCEPRTGVASEFVCSGGIDNAFARLAINSPLVVEQFQPQLSAAISNGSLALLIEHEAPGPGATPYELNVLFGERTTPTSCNPATAGCNYVAWTDTLIGTCDPRYVLKNAVVSGGKLTAGGKAYEARFFFMIGTAKVPAILKWARIQATVTISNGMVTGGSGVLGGAIHKQDLLYAINEVPEVQFTPYAKGQVIQNVSSWLVPDIDIDGNGVKESFSIGLPFTIVTGNVVNKKTGP